MLPDDHPDRIQIAFDDHRLVNNAGLILPATLALHLGLPQLVDRHLDLGDAPGRAHPGDKVMTLVASALAGGDCIDDADALRTGRTARVLGCVVKAPSTLGTFLRSFSWGHVRQLDRVSRELLAKAWAAGAATGRPRLDFTICETYGLGGRPPPRLHRPAGYHPLLAVAAGPAMLWPGCVKANSSRPPPARDGGTGALRRGQGAHGAGDSGYRLGRGLP